jgi:hypothetical protein
MKLIDALKRLKVLRLNCDSSYEPKARGSDLYDLRVQIMTDDGLQSVGRHEMGVFTQASLDDSEAFELFVVSMYQTALGNVLDMNAYNYPDTYKYWKGWLDRYRVEAETLRKDMNL